MEVDTRPVAAARPTQQPPEVPAGFENPTVCDFCGNDDWRLVFKGQDRQFHHPEQVAVWECTRCKLLATRPRPGAARIGEFYPEESYYSYRSSPTREAGAKAFVRGVILTLFRGYPAPGRAGAVLSWHAARTALKRLLAPVSGFTINVPRSVPGGTLLDVGCGAGTYLASMKRLGWKVAGVELSAQAAERCRATTGATVHAGDFLEARFPEASFDAINFSHVLEHLHSPSAALREAFRTLKPGGQLLVQVPNPAGATARLLHDDWLGWELPRHLYHFPPPTLRRRVAELGFTCVELHYRANWHTALVSVRYFLNRRLGATWKVESSRPLRAVYWPIGGLLSVLHASDSFTVIAAKPGAGPAASAENVVNGPAPSPGT